MESNVTLVISVGSLVLFLYWFRYACRLIVTAQPPRNQAKEIAAANRLAFPRVQAMLRDHLIFDPAELKTMLDRDYRILIYLLEHTWVSGPQLDAAIERWMLRIAYRVAGVFETRNAIAEMAAIVAHLASTLAERRVWD